MTKTISFFLAILSTFAVACVGQTDVDSVPSDSADAPVSQSEDAQTFGAGGVPDAPGVVYTFGPLPVTCNYFAAIAGANVLRQQCRDAGGAPEGFQPSFADPCSVKIGCRFNP